MPSPINVQVRGFSKNGISVTPADNGDFFVLFVFYGNYTSWSCNTSATGQTQNHFLYTH